MTQPICSVSFDLDTLDFYRQIYGLPPASQNARDIADPIYTHAMPRILDIFDRLGVRGTFFVIGRDAEHPAHASVLRDALARGHELANHTYHHPYHLTQLTPHEVEAEIALGAQAIETLLPSSERVVGFRCPGYNSSPQVLQALRKHRYLYDSSIFPCPPYMFARAAAIAWMAIRGRTSRSLPSVEQSWAPTQPYFPSEHPLQKGQTQDLWEIPMAVIPGLRFPYIGTFVMLYPQLLLPAITTLVARTHSLLNFELHPIDLLDATDPGLAPLVPYQRDLSVPLSEKLQRFTQCLQRIAHTHTFLPLRDATLHFQPQLRPLLRS